MTAPHSAVATMQQPLQALNLTKVKVELEGKGSCWHLSVSSRSAGPCTAPRLEKNLLPFHLVPLVLGFNRHAELLVPQAQYGTWR